MKTVDTKSLLLGILAASLVFTLTSGQILEKDDNLDFVASPTGVGIYNKSSKTLYIYRVNSMSVGMKENPENIYKVADDGSSVSKR